MPSDSNSLNYHELCAEVLYAYEAYKHALALHDFVSAVIAEQRMNWFLDQFPNALAPDTSQDRGHAA
jgi:hypothetical protein